MRKAPLTIIVVTPSDAVAPTSEATRCGIEELPDVIATALTVSSNPDEWRRAVDTVETEWCAFVHDGARLHIDAFRYLAAAVRATESAVVYTDERAALDARSEPIEILKPGWSPRLALEGHYVGSLLAMRVASIRAVGGVSDDDSTTDCYDLLLRLADAGLGIDSLPVTAVTQPTTHTWPPTQATVGGAHPAQAAALASLARRGLAGLVVADEPWQRVDLQASLDPVTIIIPTRDRVDLLARCIASIESNTDYPAYEIVVVDNDSVEPATRTYFASMPHRVVPHPGPFNFSDLMNAGAAAAKHPLLLLLNNDCEIDDPRWLATMVSELGDPTVGAVGCRLLESDGTPQHEGIGLGLRGAAALNIDMAGFCHFDAATRDVVAVTAACTLVRRDAFDQIGGFDTELAVGFGDVDFCLRLRKAGHRIIYTPRVSVTHIGMASRRDDPHRADDLFFAARWPLHRARELDPFVNRRIEMFSPLWTTPVSSVLPPVRTHSDA